MDQQARGKGAPLAADWVVGGGEMGSLIRAKPWADTPLGPIEGWPQSLRSAVSILVPSKAQIILFWGPELVAIYNDAYRPVLGAKHPDALGVPARRLFSEAWHVLEPLFMGVVNTGEAFWAKDHEFALERHGYLEETYFDVSYDPVRDESGRVGGLFCIVSDTTGRIVGERRLAALRDLGGIGAGATNAAEVLRNACAVLERYRKDLPFAALYAGRKLEVSFGIDDARRAWPLGEEELVRVGDAAVLKIATYGYLVAGINPQRGFDAAYADFFRLVSANIAGAISAVQALEDERRRAAALAELDRAKTAFFANVSHEFRTPLTLMLGPLEDVLARELAPEAREQLEVVGRNGQRLLKLVNTLLDFARIEAGRAQAAYRPAALGALTADLASNFRSACERAGLRLSVDCPPLAEPAYIDPEMWEKIVLNLLSNAFKFTLHGEIAVSLRLKDRFELEVRDTGAGIPADALPRMFERFHRVEDTRGRSHEGSGIGLALVNELVKLHGGSIAVQSTVGKGTTFTVTIPKGRAHLPAQRVKGEAAAASASRADAYVAEALGWLPGSAPAPEAKKAGPRVLLADDNADLREYARRLLAEHYEVEVAPDGQAALEAIRARPPQLVISDVMMPRLDGFGLLRELRADPALRAIPVILLSARAGEEARVEGLDKGADEYLVKPFSSRELLVRVGTLLRSAEMRRLADEARAQFETLLNEAPLGVYLVDEEFRIAAVNPVAAPVFGDIPELVGRDFAEVMHRLWPQAYADEVVQIFRRTLETGEPHVVPERVERRLDRGVTEYYEWRVSRIPLPGRRKGVVCYFRDISRSVLAREALRDADARKDEFIATLAHELRNPLAPLRSSLDILKLAGSPPPADLAIGIMDRQLTHMVRLVDDLMEVSRITRGSVELRKERVRLDVALRNAMEAAEPMIRAGHHRVHLSLAPEPIMVEADPVRLAQIFGNLLNNAAKYSEDGGDITIEVRRERGEAVVAVRDTGEGIEPEQLPQLFKIFVRGNRRTGRNQSGLGIGLALVQRLVELHGGRVEAQSDGRGKGSVFTVRLPIIAAQSVAASARRVEHPTMPPIRILLVDDNRDAADSLRALLNQVGAEVRVAHDGADALAAFEACRPRMVLLDIGMPGMDGYEVARRLRASSSGAQASLVALTGWGQDEDRRRVREAGFDHHLVKPADVAALRSLIASIQSELDHPTPS